MKVFNIFVQFISCFHKELPTLCIIKLNYMTAVRIAGCIHASPSNKPEAISWIQEEDEEEEVVMMAALMFVLQNNCMPVHVVSFWQ